MAFDQVEFPLTVARFGSSPEFATTVISFENGEEQRTGLWEDARLRFNAGPGIKSTADISALVRFFRARKGRLRGFLVKDWADFRTTGSPQGNYAPATAALQITKSYTDDGNTDVRPVTKIKQGTLVIRAGVTTLTEGVHYSITWGGGYSTTGLITWNGGNMAAHAGATISADYEFAVPARFDTDRLDLDLIHYRVTEGFGEIPDIPLVEIRDIS
jgi:uncharacterized protein (TIGR02217 family)